MTLKKIFSMILALMLLINILAPCFPAKGTESTEHVHTLQYDSLQHWGTCSCDYQVEKTDHAYGQWSFDTQKGTQSRSCSVCGYVDVLYGTSTKVSQVTEPVIGESYYLAANVGGTVYFFRHGTITDTVPYSLVVTDDVNHNWCSQVTLEDSNKTSEKLEGGFQLTYTNPTSNALTRIYCYDVKTDGNNRGIMDTGANTSAPYQNRHSFVTDEVSGTKILRKYGNNNVLVVKYNETNSQWRMLGVPESELGNEGVYPVMLANLHTHSFDSAWEHDENGHWKTCVCGSAQAPESHDYVLDEALGYGVCQCGADQKPHECASADGKWYASETQHYQLCNECGEPFNKADHTYGAWSFDAEAGSQTRSCIADCGNVQTLCGTDSKVAQVTKPAVGQSYYLVANVSGQLLSFRSDGGYTETSPYSLKTSTTLAAVTVNAALESGKGEFQLVDTTGKYIYSIAAGAGATNSVNYIYDPQRVSFCMDQVDGVSVIRAFGTQNILVAKYSDAKAAWRIWCLPESELANEDVYPVMLANLHIHTFDSDFEHDENGHWRTCDCGSAQAPEDHDYVLDETLGYGVCQCGADQKPHECASTDGKWYATDALHYQLCGKCGEAINKGEHTYGAWSFDAEKGMQTRACSTDCGSTQSLHGIDNKVAQVTTPAVGQSYYLVANVNGQLLSFRSDGGYTETSPYSLKTSTTLATVTVNAALESGKGEFQLVDTTGKYIYSIAEGAGATNSVNYIYDPQRVSFCMDQVGGVSVIRAYGTGNVLVAKYSDQKAAWRIWCLPESELANEGVYPVMLANAHTHEFGQNHEYDQSGHWQSCDCGYNTAVEKHNYVMDEALGYEVCSCGATLQNHDCASADGKWYSVDGKHYQLCGLCGKPVNEGAHSYGQWEYNTGNGSQSRICPVCNHTDTLLGTENKVSPVAEPAVGGSYYLSANVKGQIYYFVLQGSVTDTTPYSLNTTKDFGHAGLRQVTLEAPVSGNEGFQITVIRPSDEMLLRIYCYDAGGSDGIMDTGTNAGSELEKHTFTVDEVNGVKVLRKLGNNNVLVVKYFASADAWRMLGVPEEELANEGVYPVVLANAHVHSFDAAFEHDDNAHWKTCGCGYASAPEQHSFVMDETLGKEVCQCGVVVPEHECASADGMWYNADGKHYQICGICFHQMNLAEHTFGPWNYDAGAQSHSCICGYEETFWGDLTKVTPVESPVAGNSHHLAANVDGTIYFFRHGSVTETVPYSLVATDNVNHSWAFKLTVEAPIEGDEGFQLTYVHPSSGATTRIYCFDANEEGENAGVMDTGVNTGSELKKHTFIVDEVNGVKVLRKLGNNSILVLKKLEFTRKSTDADGNETIQTGTEWRMLGVDEAELANEGVYPVMLADVHTHSFEAYAYDKAGHWKQCSCGQTLAVENHSFVKDEALGYDKCLCGATIPPHDCASADGKWYGSEENHYQLCDICNEKLNVQNHTYGPWTMDAEKGTQSRSCGVCAYVHTLYGTNTKVSAVDVPAIGGSYYLTANVEGTVQFFRHGTVTETVPYSLVVTDNVNHNWTLPVTLEAPVEGGAGFQLTYINPATESLVRIYCYDAGGSDGVMDTGVNSASELKKHTFVIDEVDGVKVLRKLGNDNILVVKYFAANDAYRMLGVPEAELANEGVYPVMLANVHTHSVDMEKYAYDKLGHWHACDCGFAQEAESHSYVLDEKLGCKVCKCGAVVALHTCESKDGKWYEADGKHYQLCHICFDKIHMEDHTYGPWKFDTENGTQEQICTVCGYVSVLLGTDAKVIPVEAPAIGGSYYLAANVEGIIQFFRHGTVTETVPYSLVVTDNVKHNWLMPVTLEAPAEGTVGFQMTYTNPTTEKTVSIYCYDANLDGENAGIMDTGVNSGCELKKHTFTVDEVNGVKVLRKLGNNNILVVKYSKTLGAWRMLGVPESELANEGVYPVMLAQLHAHSHTDTTYHSDTSGHWYACSCGGKSEYAEHTVTMWEITVAATETTAGSKTGVCTLCGATAIKEIPPSLPDGYYYLTGTLDGVTYYFRDKTGAESVEHTVPFSMYTTTQKSGAQQVDIVWDEATNTYTISYFTNRQLNVYMGDVNGSTIQKDGKIDLSSSATTSASLIAFSWDPVSRNLYQMEGKVKYVMAFKRLTNTSTNQQEVRLMALPESELGADAVAVRFEVIHQHSYNLKWSVDAIYHWQECDCGTRKYEAEHTVPEWTVDREATQYSAGSKSGVCTVCGERIVNAIPMLNDHVTAPVSGGKYYLTGLLNGVRYYFRHAPSGGSVTTTVPYSLYTDTETSNVITVKVSGYTYKLGYGTSGYYIYINGTGAGTTSKEDASLVDFLWDEDNKLLYQDEGGIKHVLVFKLLKNNKTGATEVRITAMPMEQALIDPSVAIAQLSTQGPAPKEDERLSAVDQLPADATALKQAPEQQLPAPEQHTDDAISPRVPLSSQQTDTQESSKPVVTAVIVSGSILLVIAVALILLRNTKLGMWLLAKWNLWTAVAFVGAAAVLVGGMLLGGAAKADAPSLADFTIVANAGNLDTAEELAVTIYEKYGISLPVVQSKDYQGNMGIYLDTQGKNSYGGYKYSVYSEDGEYGPGIYINGSGPSLETAVSKWLKSVKDTSAYPFGLQETISGYEWNTDDINMTGLGFSLAEAESRELYDGVELRKLSYESFGYGKVSGYAVIVDSDAEVELKVAAGAWDENTNPDNPGEKHTVGQYGKMLTEDGYEVLAITNAGFYDLNTTMTYIPWGLQIVDGSVKKEPSEDNPNNTDNWFAQTADGKYVISDTAGYFETYETTLAQGVGGGRVLMEDGKPCFSTTGTDYRTVVGITEGGDLIILTMPSANYAFIAQIFMDMDLDVDCVLNLDGGGSTTLHTLNENGELTRFVCETPIEREVADAIAIVKKN